MKYGIPQIIMIVIMGIGLGIALVKDGERKDEKYSFWVTVISTAIQCWILKAGGFF